MANADFAGQRVKMVDGQIRTTDVTNAALLSAMLAVPRENFVPAKRRELAYIDEGILVAGDGGDGSRYLMEPSPFAKLAQLAEIRSGDAILDVGTCTGYSAAVLSHLGKSVTALESNKALAAQARATLAGFGNVTVVEGPLPEGFTSKAPYGVILVGGCVEELPATLLAQLEEGGRLVVVEGSGNAGIARLSLKSNGVVSSRRAFNAAVKPLPGFERTPAFEF